MSEIFLEKPNLSHEKQVMNYRKCFSDMNESFDGCACLEDTESYLDWLNFEERLSNKFKDSYVPSSLYLAIRKEDGKLVGMIDLRHKLNDFLLKYGGHIGYSVLPQERRKGYAKQMLKLILEKCKIEKINKVLLTCKKNNIASRKVIMACGGVFENDILYTDQKTVISRYFINI